MPATGKGFSDFVNNVHLPYWYKRIKRRSSQTDFQVDVPPIKGAELKSETQVPCPGCRTDLNLYALHGLEIEGCPACKGIWLDRDELRKLKDKSQTGTWRTLRWLDDEMEAMEKAHAVLSSRACPKCEDKKLLATKFGESNVLIDLCPSCQGIWLDRDEFQEILDYLNDKLDTLTSAEMRHKVLEEIKEIWTGPESTLSELQDAHATIMALMCITVFEHPTLVRALQGMSETARSLGL